MSGEATGWECLACNCTGDSAETKRAHLESDMHRSAAYRLLVESADRWGMPVPGRIDQGVPVDKKGRRP